MKLSRIEPDRAADLHSVVAACFAEGASDYWSAADLTEILILDNCYGYSAPSEDLVDEAAHLGFIVVRVVGDEAEILSLAVLPSHRRAGIAGALVGAAMADLQARDAGRWFLKVRVDNLAAIGLYESMDFSAVGHRPNYYRDALGRRSDALAMRYTENPK